MKDRRISWVRGAQDVRTNGKTVSNSVYVVAPRPFLVLKVLLRGPSLTWPTAFYLADRIVSAGSSIVRLMFIL